MSLRPEMKVLYVSGYMDQGSWESEFIESSIAFLPKPFTPDALKLKVREALGQ